MNSIMDTPCTKRWFETLSYNRGHPLGCDEFAEPRLPALYRVQNGDLPHFQVWQQAYGGFSPWKQCIYLQREFDGPPCEVEDLARNICEHMYNDRGQQLRTRDKLLRTFWNQQCNPHSVAVSDDASRLLMVGQCNKKNRRKNDFLEIAAAKVVDREYVGQNSGYRTKI